ncbi:MAG: hypothetical protein IJN80_07900 [Clostridia bacterium]|nr:hypothetical protein [Clostridia bacterium]
MKRMICLILALLLLCPATYAAGDLKLILTATEANVGETATVTVEAKGAPVTCSYKVVLTYDDTVLKPQKVKNADSSGIFMDNIKATHEGKPAVNALSVDAAKAFEGDCKLFTVTFELLKEPADASGSPITVAYTEFYDYDLKALTPDIESCSIKVPAKNAETTPETDTPAVNDTPDTDTPDTDTPDTEEKPAEDKKPTGDWEIDEEKGEITHTKEDGTKEEYKGEISYDKDDKPTKIELTDKDGKPAGSLTVTEKEDGSIKVEEQELIENKEETERPIDDGGEEIAIIPWAWILPAAAILLIGGVVIILIIVKKHKKEEE